MVHFTLIGGSQSLDLVTPNPLAVSKNTSLQTESRAKGKQKQNLANGGSVSVC